MQPQPGELWGVEVDAVTHKFVQQTDERSVWYASTHWSTKVSRDDWQQWLAVTGAVRLYPPTIKDRPCP